MLRFSEIELLSALRQEPEWCGLSSIQSRVRPHSHPSQDLSYQPKIIPQTRPKLTEKAASTIQSSAQGIASLKLKEALLRLSERRNRG